MDTFGQTKREQSSFYFNHRIVIGKKPFDWKVYLFSIYVKLRSLICHIHNEMAPNSAISIGTKDFDIRFYFFNTF